MARTSLLELASGASVDQTCFDRYQELKLGKRYKYITYQMNKNNTEITVDKFLNSDDWQDFLKVLPEDEPRFAVYDLEYEVEDGGKRNKLLFIYWSPEVAKIKQKMVYSASKDALRRGLVGISTDVQANDMSDLDLDTVREKVRRGKN